MKKTYAVSDLHGCLDLYKQIKNFIKPGDKVYFLGDATDRGPQSWELAKTIYNDPQFIYLKGNHEDMLVKTALHYYGDDWDSEDNSYALINNGGAKTWNDMSEDPEKMEYIQKLKSLPTEKIYLNKNNETIYLSHAGFSLESKITNLLWDRGHFTDEWPKDKKDFYIVHGHTPVQYLRKVLYGNHVTNKNAIEPEVYADGHKIDIDMATYFSKACCLLDLDTFEAYILQLKE